MPVFQVGTPVTTTVPTVEVTSTAAAPLSKGTHQFQLQVVDDDGNISDPVSVSVIVKDTQKPTAVLKAPSPVQPGVSFTLDGSQSSDVAPGSVVQWIWTMKS